ncbi:MAG: hypothetical protein M3Y39_20160 [Chloroflexota bacterium]|nr:hypothetical protein [Chloroflexota bacterium]
MECADEARLQLAAFFPQCQSLSMRSLRQRQQVVYHLRRYVVAATEALAAIGSPPQPRRRPVGWRVVEGSVIEEDGHGQPPLSGTTTVGDEWGDDPQEHDPAGSRYSAP